MNLKRVVTHALPLALLTFSLLTVKIVAACVDGPVDKRFGFPFSWIRPDPIFSISQIVDLKALVIDFCVYLIVFVLLSRTALFKQAFEWRPRLTSACLWLAAVALAGFYVLILSHGASIGGVSFGRSDACSKVLHYSLKFGPQIEGP